jgi:hypothetical protein
MSLVSVGSLRCKTVNLIQSHFKFLLVHMKAVFDAIILFLQFLTHIIHFSAFFFPHVVFHVFSFHSLDLKPHCFKFLKCLHLSLMFDLVFSVCFSHLLFVYGVNTFNLSINVFLIGSECVHMTVAHSHFIQDLVEVDSLQNLNFSHFGF